MATYTTNYNLKKPAETDFILVGDFNDNADIIDAELKKRPVVDDEGKLSESLLPDLTAKFETKGAVNSAVSSHNTNSNAHQDIRQAINLKQDTLTFDTAPTEGSANPVTSGGVKTALDAKAPTPIIGTSAPNNQTAGVEGQLYLNRSGMNLYACLRAITSTPAYWWYKVITTRDVDNDEVDTPSLRNEYFVAKADYTDSNAPTVEGQICWLYG